MSASSVAVIASVSKTEALARQCGTCDLSSSSFLIVSWACHVIIKGKSNLDCSSTLHNGNSGAKVNDYANTQSELEPQIKYEWYATS